MERDPITGETFLRIVGRRSRPPIGEPPSAEARRAHASLLQYRTRAPKGIFIYRSHEEMEADRMRWTVEAIVARAGDDGAACGPKPRAPARANGDENG
jgi:hypothetical protein